MTVDLTLRLNRLFTGLLLIGASVNSAAAQQVEPAVPTPIMIPTVQDSTTAVSPGGAFLRSLLLPGWGHLVTGSPTRGGFYFGTAAFDGYMLFKTKVRVSSAQDSEALRRMEVEAEFIREGVDPDSIPDLVDADERVQSAAELVEVREQQLEDWIAWSVFMLLLGGADAFVSAHLADFPQPLGIEARPIGSEGRVEVGIKLGVQGPGG